MGRNATKAIETGNEAPIATSRLLTAAHAAYLAERGVSAEVAIARGYRSVANPADLPGEWARASDEITDRISVGAEALVIPLFSADDPFSPSMHQLRLDDPRRRPSEKHPEGKVIKFEAPRGAKRGLEEGDIPADVHPLAQDDALGDAPLIFTEGIPKGDALLSAARAEGLRVVPVSFTGVTMVYETDDGNRRSLHSFLSQLPLRGREVYLCWDSDWRENGLVRLTLVRTAELLAGAGAEVHFVSVPPLEHSGKTGVDDWLAASHSHTLQHLLADCLTDDVGDDEPADGSGGVGEFTDAVIAERAASEALSGRWLWTAGLGWLRWVGRVWAGAADAAAVEVIRQWVISLAQDAAEKVWAAGNDAERSRAQAQLAGCLKLLSDSRINSIVRLCRGQLLIDAGKFDADPDILVARNGVIDLRTGALLPHDPARLVTRSCNTDYQAGATHPDWSQALTAVPADCLDWLQVRLGQAITGHTPDDDRLLLLRGSGENGKTTILGAFMAAVGDHAQVISDRVLLADPSAHPTELMDLRGLRMAVIEETPEARRLSVSRMKKVLGTPTITARHCGKDDTSFTATHTLFVSSNYRPIIEETDHGTWRRLALLQFPYRFRKQGEKLAGPLDRTGDPGLRPRVIAGAEGQHTAILAWGVEGAKRWYAAGRTMPPLPARVESDTLAWRGEWDLVLAWVGERLVAERGKLILAASLQEDFGAWLASHGQHAWSARTLVARLEAHDWTAEHHVERRTVKLKAGDERLSRPQSWPPSLDVGARTAKVWMGVRFRSETDEAADDTHSGEAEQIASEPLTSPVTGVTDVPAETLRESLAWNGSDCGNSGNRDLDDSPARTRPTTIRGDNGARIRTYAAAEMAAIATRGPGRRWLTPETADRDRARGWRLRRWQALGLTLAEPTLGEPSCICCLVDAGDPHPDQVCPHHLEHAFAWRRDARLVVVGGDLYLAGPDDPRLAPLRVLADERDLALHVSEEWSIRCPRLSRSGMDGPWTTAVFFTRPGEGHPEATRTKETVAA